MLRHWEMMQNALAWAGKFLRTKLADRFSYNFDRIPFGNGDLSPYTHLVASREGLYAVNPTSWVKILEGQFFGLTVRGSSIFCFQAHDHIWSPSRRGRILELGLEGSRIRGAWVRAKGLDNGCHQIDFLGDDLFLVDTYNQRVLRLGPSFRVEQEYFPIPPAPREDWASGYAHVNSIVRHEGQIYLLKSNGGVKTGQRSEVLRCDEELRPQEVMKLPGLMCHNIVFLEDGTLLSCGSIEGALIRPEGVILQVGEMMTRGLSVGDDTLVVGDSFFTTRHRRRFVPGRVHFYDRGYRHLATLQLPGAPTEIRRIDGQDLSLSNHPRPTGTKRLASV